MNTVEKLRNEFPTFTFDSFSWKLTNQDLDLSFHYSLSPQHTFNSQLTIHSIDQNSFNLLSEQDIDVYVANIGMSELFSYWKLTASPNICVTAHWFSSQELAFWKQLLIEGMGEYFYQNKINFSDPSFVTYSCPNNPSPDIKQAPNKSQSLSGSNPKISKVLIPVGGGKDSALTLELLNSKFETGSLTISAPKSASDVIAAAKIPESNQLRVTRTLDQHMLDLNSQGFLNGHVPISASIAFISLLAAKVAGYSHIAISNERSSNEGNVWYCDKEINHQYSKTYTFETALQEYVNNHLPEGAPYYFSFLRPLYELQIGKLFAQQTQYHHIFRSCNRGQKTNSWCCECSKCLFAWIILYPFISEENLTNYFTKDLFQAESLWPVAEELLGLTETKPFECVGTHEESIAAFWLSLKKFKSESPESELPVILSQLETAFKTNEKLQTGPSGETDLDTRAQTILNAFNQQHTLPQEFSNILESEIKRLTPKENNS